ncbi:inorganic phosphate transporter [Luteolibacter ambystomatis]|uniref:Phosphate transporter n=1 Tax=Luteolibacter ambystomatis TaxID=2824561 RepID=A0A975J128_9BACT|nr:inorganic phosphate transporter [Luteolibacter ambystomatis]QUE52078.1 inorganic phosphate transporter [Luteolibacter ambystomatis]
MTLIIVVILVALAFEFINGFHDTANSIATVVSTKVLTPRQAIMLAAFTNLFGALIGHAVAKTVSSGLVDAKFVTTGTIICALVGGISWNLLTWWLGLPSSSTHALVGGLCGATLANSQGNWKAIIWSAEKIKDGKVVSEGVLHKVIWPMLTSPVVGLVGGFIVMTILYALLRNAKPMWVNRFFGRAQIFSASYMGFAHGLADAQKTMGIITLALVTATTAGSFEHLPSWMGFLKMDKSPVAEHQIQAILKGSKDPQVAAILATEADKLQTGEFKESFHALAAIAYQADGDAAAAERERTSAKQAHQQALEKEAARFMPKVPILGPMVAGKPTDWLKTLEGEMTKASKDGKDPLAAAAGKVRDLSPDVPAWIKIICALIMAAGTASGGWRIIKTMGHKMVKLQPVHGFAAETTAATLLAVTGQMGMTVSTTHAITTAIMGVGATKRFSAIDGGIVKKILGAWVLTLPAAGGVAYGVMWLWLKIAG